MGSTVRAVPKPNNEKKLSEGAFAWRSFGTIGYDMYLKWVLGEKVDLELEGKK